LKLIMAIVQDKDAPRLVDALVEKGFRSTKLASTGGFLREGNTTLFVGTEDHQVSTVINVIKRTCRAREQLVTPLAPVSGPSDSYVPYPVEVQVGGATIFVLPVESLEKV